VIKVPKIREGEPIRVIKDYLFLKGEDEVEDKHYWDLPTTDDEYGLSGPLSTSQGYKGIFENINEWEMTQKFHKENSKLLSIIALTKNSLFGLHNRQEFASDLVQSVRKIADNSISLTFDKFLPYDKFRGYPLMSHEVPNVNNFGFNEKTEKVVFRDYGSLDFQKAAHVFHDELLKVFEILTDREKEARGI
jgi:hypothetical protein